MDECMCEFQCPCCGKNIEVDLMKYASIEEGVEREMGAEIEHMINFCDYRCPECNNLLGMSGSFWEYSEGALNHSEVEIYPPDEWEDILREVEECEDEIRKCEDRIGELEDKIVELRGF